MTELDSAWEDQIKELAKKDPIKAYNTILKEICEQDDCEARCAFLRRVAKHILVQTVLSNESK